MKNPLREAFNEDRTKLDVTIGQYVFYLTSRIFGKIVDITSAGFVVEWRTSSGNKQSYYQWDSISMYNSSGMRELLDQCLLCETDEERLFIALKYGK
jgi:hypothetical protein